MFLKNKCTSGKTFNIKHASAEYPLRLYVPLVSTESHLYLNILFFQELAEARDALLKQVNMTQTEQTRLQDELDTVLCEQGSQPSLVLPDVFRTDPPSSSPSFPSNSTEFLEELEKLSKLSSHDVPLEWELSVPSEDGVFGKELVSNESCTKYECIELKRKHDHLVEVINKVQGSEEGAFVEEPQINLLPLTADGVKKTGRINSEGNESQKNCPRGEEHSSVSVAARRNPLGSTDGDFTDGDFRERIVQLETENISLEKKLFDQLEVFSSEKQHLQQKCDSLQIGLDQASLSGRELEQELVKQNDVLQQTVTQLRQQVDQRAQGTSVQVESQTANLDDDQKMQIQYLTVVLESKENLIVQLQDRLQLLMSNNCESNQDESVGEQKDVCPDVKTSEVSFEGKELDRVEHVIPGNVPKTISRSRPSKDVSDDQLCQSDSPQHAGDDKYIDQSFSTSDDNSYHDLSSEHTTLIEELHKLQQKHHELKMRHAEEKALLQEELERGKLTIQLLQGQTECENHPFTVEVVELRKELAVLKEFNTVLSFENKCFYERMRDQEHLVLCLKEELNRDDASFKDWQNTFGRQLLLLQRQREQLLQQIENGHSKQNQLASLLGEKTVMEETLRREKEILLEKLVQFEDLQQQLTRRGIHFEHFLGEQRRLEQLLLLKDENEKQLMRQKRLLQEELFEIETKLREREAMLQEEKMRLLREVKEKNVTIKKLESLNVGDASGDGMELRVSHSRGRRSSMGRLEEYSQLQLGGSWHTGEQSYDEAIDILRNKLKMEYEAKEASLKESHAGQMASFWNEQSQKVPNQ